MPIIYCFYPETAGRALEDIDTIFTHSQSIFDTVKIAGTTPKTDLGIMTSGNKLKPEEGSVEQLENAQPQEESRQRTEPPTPMGGPSTAPPPGFGPGPTQGPNAAAILGNAAPEEEKQAFQQLLAKLQKQTVSLLAEIP